MLSSDINHCNTLMNLLLSQEAIIIRESMDTMNSQINRLQHKLNSSAKYFRETTTNNVHTYLVCNPMNNHLILYIMLMEIYIFFVE